MMAPLAAAVASLLLEPAGVAAEDGDGDVPSPKSPAEGLASIRVRPGMAVDLAAAEPLVMDPIDVAWGADGRLWVVEMADYPLGLDGDGKRGGRVRFLEDTDGDGKYERSTLFATGLNFPTGVMPWRDGVLVTAAPEILLLRDTGGDGQADERRVLFDGFKEGNQQHRVNGPRWGLDNWIYLANGDSGGVIRSLATGETLDLGGRDLRIRPDAGLVDAATGRTQYGRNRDDWGNWFGCNNSNPLWHFVLADHYLRRNPHYAAPPSIRYLQERAAPVFPVSETLERFNRPESANRFTSACGAMIYRDRLLGDAFYGNAFIAEPVHNLVQRQVLTADGATFTSHRAEGEENAEFFASTDHWCRPVAVKTGPDGALWIVDFYRFVIEHPQWIPDDWEAKLELRAGEDRGRIYRVYPEGVKPGPVPRLDGLDAAGLVAALDSPNGWQRDMAHQLLLWRGGDAAVTPLLRMVREGREPAGRLQALCVLDGLGKLTGETIVDALRDPHPGVRRHAIRLSESMAGKSDAVKHALPALAGDADAQVRHQLALSLGEWKNDPEAGHALARLAIEGDDAELRAAVLSSALPHLEILAEIVSSGGAGNESAVNVLAGELLNLAASMDNRAVMAQLLTHVTAKPGGGTAPRLTALGEVLDCLARKSFSLQSLHADSGGEIREALAAADELIGEAREIAASGTAPLPDRIAAAKVLGRGMSRQLDDINLLVSLLSPREPSELQLSAVASLGRLGRREVAEKLLTGWSAYSPAVRTAILEPILSRATWTEAFFDEAEKRPELLAGLDAARRQALIVTAGKGIRERAEKLFGKSESPDREAVMQRYRPALEMPGDADRGKVMFNSLCASCHRLEETGTEIGPDLAALTDKSAGSMLAAIVDPNRAVEDKFVQYVAVTGEGRTVAGILKSEAGNSITLLGLDGIPQTILRGDLASLTSTGRSLMPEGLEAALNAQQMADVIAFIARAR